MKKITLLALFTIMVSMVSCKKDDAEKNTDRLTGKWALESATYTTYENGQQIEREQDSDLNINWEFRSDGRATVNLDGGDVEVGWAATESLLTLKAGNNEATNVDLEIKSLSKTNLHLELVINNEVVNNTTYKTAYEYKLRKL